MNRRTFVSIGGGMLASGVLRRESTATLFAQAAATAQSPSSSSKGPIVDTTSGKVRGAELNGVATFKGVPYGGSTAGAGRFMPPGKPKAWTGVRDALAFGPRAPQFYGGEPPEVAATDPREPLGEDCLVLNVWTPDASARQKRPVMVWLHGGGFTSGSASYTMYDGKELARKHDVVVVGVNHRLNVFGFLYLAELGGPQFAHASNAGMLDIVAALEWVRDNIGNFGGDPASVTIFGQSGGAGKVSTLMAMPSAKGLFHRAIAQSGAALTGAKGADATKTAEAVLQKLGLSRNQLVELQKMPMERVLEVARGGLGQPGALNFGPVVDGSTLPRDPFTPTAPDLSAGIPFLTGTTATEVTFFGNTALDPLDDRALHMRVKDTLRVDDGTTVSIIALYKKSRPKASNLDVALLIATDSSFFRSGVETQAERKAAQGKAPAYVYRFEWYSPIRDGKLRSYHTLEIPFVFDNVDGNKTMTGSGQDRYALADKMSRAWVAFAKTGNPNHGGLPKWEPFTAAQRATMVFNDECRAVNDPHGEERKALAALKSRA
jgi:para-nitrobenzyl esterase